MAGSGTGSNSVAATLNRSSYMSFVNTSSKPSVLGRALRSARASALLLAGLTGSLVAQSGSGSSPDGPSQPRQEGHGDQAGPPRHRMGGMALEGPASPAILRDTVQLTGAKLQQYTKQYDAYMASTKVARDSLRASFQSMRSELDRGDRDSARDRRDVLRRQSQDLSKRDQQFEKDVKGLLNKDQQKRYDKWKDDRQKNARTRWRHDRPHRGEQDSVSRPQER
jgi:hypothetical protein